MIESIYCSTCLSTQVIAQKHELIGSEAHTNAAQISGKSLLAGYAKSRPIDAICLACGTKWKLVQQADRMQAATLTKHHADSLIRIEWGEVWRRNFLDLYQRGQYDQASELLQKEHPMLYENLGLEGSYESIRKKMTGQQTGEWIGFLLVAFIIIIMIVLVIESSH